MGGKTGGCCLDPEKEKNRRAKLSNKLVGREITWSDKIATAHVVHGLSTSTEYNSWYAMLIRCYDSDEPQYKDYGGRGITVCDRWKPDWHWVGGSLSVKDAVLNFYSDLGPKPTGGFTLERINNDGNYEPTNCKWATRQDQARNRRQAKI